MCKHIFKIVRKNDEIIKIQCVRCGYIAYEDDLINMYFDGFDYDDDGFDDE